MAQIAWKVRSNRGRSFSIGLFHGDTTGHVMLYCNNSVVQVDFSVDAPKEYKLMLDDELCVVAIDQAEDGTYAYSCELDRESQTPLNEYRQAERAEEEKHERQRLIVAGVAVAIMAVVIVFFVLR